MLRRTKPPADPVTIHLDDTPVVASRGEPLAVALLAADATTLARSPKLHRPRGPSCLRGGCDGCLARVDGEPNVMTCLRPARGGERIETQNVVGSRRADLLRVTDWFFPQGIDHHHLMAGIPGVQDLMQSFARKLAGLGRLPAEPTPPRPAGRVETDVLVIGGGLAGLTVAARISAGGARALLVDDGLELGGSLACSPALRQAWLGALPLEASFVRERTAAVGIYSVPEAAAGSSLPLEVLLASADGGTALRCRAVVFATGAHDAALATPNNDLPGVFSARALCRIVAHGITPDGKVAVIGDDHWARTLAAALDETAVVKVATEDLVAIKGSGQVKQVEVRGARGRTRKVAVVAVAVATPPAPAFELAAQAGARVRHEPAGYVLERDPTGRIGPGLWAAGECAGLAFDPDAIAADADRVAAQVIASLSPL